MIKRPQATITIPRKSPISRDEVEATLKKQWRHVDFTFCEGDVDSIAALPRLVASKVQLFLSLFGVSSNASNEGIAEH